MADFSTHWRDSARKTKFFFIEAQVCMPILLCLFHFRTWTVVFCLSVIIFLSVLSYFQITLFVFLILLREWVVGRQKTVSKK